MELRASPLWRRPLTLAKRLGFMGNLLQAFESAFKTSSFEVPVKTVDP